MKTKIVGQVHGRDYVSVQYDRQHSFSGKCPVSLYPIEECYFVENCDLGRIFVVVLTSHSSFHQFMISFFFIECCDREILSSIAIQ